MTVRERRWRYSLGIELTEADYDRMLKQQKGRCAICRRPPRTRRLDVDHDHKTGRIRGLLCSNCNRFFGRLERGRTPAKCFWLFQRAAYYFGKEGDRV